jgi:hypothetical protein
MSSFGSIDEQEGQQEEQVCEQLRPNGPQPDGQEHQRRYHDQSRTQGMQSVAQQTPIQQADGGKDQANLQCDEPRDTECCEYGSKQDLWQDLVIDPDLIPRQVRIRISRRKAACQNVLAESNMAPQVRIGVSASGNKADDRQHENYNPFVGTGFGFFRRRAHTGSTL